MTVYPYYICIGYSMRIILNSVDFKSLKHKTIKQYPLIFDKLKHFSFLHKYIS